MPFKGLIIGVIIVIVLIAAYSFINKKKDDKDQVSSCPSSFTIHPLGTFIQNAISVTYSTDGTKYFSQSSGGYGGYQGQLAPKEIKKEVFVKACEEYKKQAGL